MAWREVLGHSSRSCEHSASPEHSSPGAVAAAAAQAAATAHANPMPPGELGAGGEMMSAMILTVVSYSWVQEASLRESPWGGGRAGGGGIHRGVTFIG